VIRAVLRLAVALLKIWLRPRRPAPAESQQPRIVAPGEPSPRAELALLALLGCASACAVGFVVIYALDLSRLTQWLGLALGLMFAALAAAFVVLGHRLVPQEEIEEDYPPPEREHEQRDVVDIVEQSGVRFTRKRLIKLAALGTGGAVGAALITPAVSFGPVFEVGALARSPWRRGRRLVDERGRPLAADDVEPESFYTAFPEGADREDLAAPLVVVRLDPADLDLPAGREGWAPGGILAYSKICTHAACAISLYRKPKFAPTQPRPALVCPCHYSTFDPATGGTVIFGPAGRPLPQLPLQIDAEGNLRAGGNYSGRTGPSWWGVRH
jgi:ubiquinol-cytochrome c reductase iron-sulfur subunit